MHNKTAISGWIHFNSLTFLEKVLDIKQIQSQVLYENESSTMQSTSDFVSNNEANDDIETIVIEQSDEEECVTNDENNFDYIQQQQQRLRLINQQKLNDNCCPHQPGDEIMHFFKSITPFLAMMDPTMKLRVRISIQEIILNEISRKLNNNKADKPKAVPTKGVRKKTEATTSDVAPKRHSKRVIKKNRKYFEK